MTSRAFAFEAVRDLIGILRAMYREEKTRDFASPARLEAIRRVATDLRAATRKAADHDEGTPGYKAAVAAADAAIVDLAELCSVVHPMQPVLLAAGARVRGVGARKSERRIQWAVGKRR